MKARKRFSPFQAKRKLMRQLDASLLTHATALCSVPSIEQVYRLRGLADTHFLLRNQYRLTPEDVTGLLCFADPLEAADQYRRLTACSEMFPISALLDEMNAYQRYPLAFTKNQ
ncbi:hypothetical protein D7X33_18825 [Butyricicoccus sp. 1XD8-22]|nr:hypothetical protein D7X33_18825 [Butyricicoccus sp. 1XD8-22]